MVTSFPSSPRHVKLSWPGPFRPRWVRRDCGPALSIRLSILAVELECAYRAFSFGSPSFRTRAGLHAEILALRQQLAVCQKNAPRRLRLHRCDRLWSVVLYLSLANCY